MDTAFPRSRVDSPDDTNPARRARPPRRTTSSSVSAIWTAAQLGEFLEVTKTKRLYPALHLGAHTGIRRGELAGLNWADFDGESARLSIVRTRQVTSGGTAEAPVKTRTSRRRIDLDANTIGVLWRWRRRLKHEGATIDSTSAVLVNRHHHTPSPESFSQLFARPVAATHLPRIRFHDYAPYPRVAAGRRGRSDQGRV